MQAQESLYKGKNEEEKPQKSGFFSKLFGFDKQKAPSKPKCAMKKEVEKERKASYDSDEDEMEIKNYMMEKN